MAIRCRTTCGFSLMLTFAKWVDGRRCGRSGSGPTRELGNPVGESNLSFRGGDISNSDQDPTDLPLCGHSYTVYEYNYGRGPQQAVHNHMHQFERIFALINGGQPFSRFWSAASCGTTHRPPNSDDHYQYDSITLATSDCEKWSMVGPQAGTGVNAQTWSRNRYPTGIQNSASTSGGCKTFQASKVRPSRRTGGR